MAAIKLFATDLDGTVLIDRGQDGCHATPRLKAALRELQARGVTVCLASGRMHESIRHIGDEMGVGGPVISYNGAMLRGHDDAIWLHHTLDPLLAAEIVELCEARALPLNYYLDGVLHARKLQPWWDLYQGRTSSPMVAVESHRHLAGRQPTKLLIYAQAAVIAGLKAELQAPLAGRCELVITADEYLEFLPMGADKGHALADLAARLGLGADQVAAAGDGWNDVGMLRWAGTGVAMANGRPDLHAHADHVVPGPEDDGLAIWIEETLLTKERHG